MQIPAREVRPGDFIRGIAEVTEVTSNWGVVYIRTHPDSLPVPYSHGDPVAIDRPTAGDWRDSLVAIDSLTAGDAYRVFQALCTEVRRLEAANTRSRSDLADSIEHTRALRDVFARLIG